MRRILTLVALFLASLTSPAFGQTPSIVIDGNFADCDITLRLDLDLDSLTGCQGGEVAISVTESEPGGSLAASPDCWTSDTIPGAVTSFPAHNAGRFLEAAIPLSTLGDVTPGTYGFRFSGVAVSPAPVSIDYLTPALYFPGRTSTPHVILQVNESDFGVVFTPSGQVRLTVDMPETTYTGNLSWYWVVVIDGQVSWITARGISATPAPFVVAPPVPLNHVVLLDIAHPGAWLVTAFFLMDGDTFVAWDTVTVIKGSPCCDVPDADGLAAKRSARTSPVPERVAAVLLTER
jgi:hypothetical protein